MRVLGEGKWWAVAVSGWLAVSAVACSSDSSSDVNVPEAGAGGLPDSAEPGEAGRGDTAHGGASPGGASPGGASPGGASLGGANPGGASPDGGIGALGGEPDAANLAGAAGSVPVSGGGEAGAAASCHVPTDCDDAHSCVGSQSVKLCVPEAEYCDDQQPCVQRSQGCLGHRCLPALPLGNPCESSHACASGYCNAKLGVCDTPASGCGCDRVAQNCADGSVCLGAVSILDVCWLSVTECAPIPSLVRCGEGWPTCATGTICYDDRSGAQPYCATPTGNVGDPCVFSPTEQTLNICEPGLRCAASAASITGGACVPLGAPGGACPCRADAECGPNDTCVAKAKDGQSCQDVGCVSGERCATAAANGSCGFACLPGSARCTDASHQQTCAADGSAWAAPVACPGGFCNGVGVCGDCAPGALDCADATHQAACVAGKVVPSQCPSGAPTCSNRECVPCVGSSTRCASDSEIETCSASNWSAPQACPQETPICSNDACVVCLPTSTRCSQTGSAQVCSPAGVWVDDPSCGTGKVCNQKSCGPQVVQVEANGHHSCALFADGTVKCWGDGGYGELGYGNTDNIGDDEPVSAAPNVSITTTPGVSVAALALGYNHTCALLSDGTVKCWGANYAGQLGYGNTNYIGDDELPSSVDTVSVTNTPGVKVVQLSAGYHHTCALLSDGTVKCWGQGVNGALGYGSYLAIGDDELPSSVGTVSVTTAPGVTVTQIVAGGWHTCALLSDGGVKCWGTPYEGQLGYGNNLDWVGKTSVPSSVANVSITTKPGVVAMQVVAGENFTCALLTDASVQCWGLGQYGELGHGNLASIGDDELPSSVPAVNVTNGSGPTVASLAAGDDHVCAQLSDASIKCWGNAEFGALGYGNTNNIGDDESPATVGAVSVTTVAGLSVTQLTAGGWHNCALLSNGTVKCWGAGQPGLLGNASNDNIGDNELPSSVPTVPFW